MWLPASALLTVLGALALVALACFLGNRQRWRGSIVAVAAAALIIRAYASADLALHPWDERYHALVAKNLIQTPLTPRLYSTPLLDVRLPLVDGQLHLDAQASAGAMASSRVDEDVRRARIRAAAAQRADLHGCRLRHVLYRDNSSVSGRRPAGGDFPDVQRISRGSDIRAPRERSRGHPADFSFRARHSACSQREPAQFRGRRHRPGGSMRVCLLDEIISGAADAPCMGSNAAHGAAGIACAGAGDCRGCRRGYRGAVGNLQCFRVPPRIES